MKRRRYTLFALLMLATSAVATDIVVPNSNLKIVGIPPIPAALASKVAPYTEFKPNTAVSWHPTRRELVVATRGDNTTQLHRVTGPGAALIQLTDFAEPVRNGAFLLRRPDVLVFSRDTGGNEQRQVYRLDPGAKEPALLTDPARRNEPAGVTRTHEFILIESTELDQGGRRENPTVDLTLVDPLDLARSRKLATLPGTGWGDFSFSFDDKRLAMIEFKSVNESYVWIMDVATGARTRVLPAEIATAAKRIASADLNFARDGKGLFLATDRDGEFRKLAYLDLATGNLEYFASAGNWDVEQVTLSPDGRTLAVLTNEAGVGVLRLYDAETRRELPRPALPLGTVRGATWHENSRDLAVNLNSAQSPGDVYSVNVQHMSVDRWTQSAAPGIDATQFRTPQPITWKTFDGLMISGFVTRPDARYKGKRPVLIHIHGGPEAQSRPGFMGRWNYFVDELGVAVIDPNVRGSTGYGKTFATLDNGTKREDSVKDIAALLDWIATQPDLDASRVVVYGGSYGGYMTLAVATNYPDRIAGAIDAVGIANFVSFLENTESYRRDLRRVEYGDERDPAMRAFLTRISPVTNAHKIKAPLFVAHGKNDPRVPYTEAEQIVDIARKNGAPVWYLLANNEGHGFAKKANADFYFYSMIAFLERALLAR